MKLLVQLRMSFEWSTAFMENTAIITYALAVTRALHEKILENSSQVEWLVCYLKREYSMKTKGFATQINSCNNTKI